MKVKLFALLCAVLLLGMFALLGAVSPASAQGPTPTPNPAPYGPWGGWNMMAGHGMTLAPHASAGVGGWWGGYPPTQGYTPTAPYGNCGWGPGGMMGGMMGGYGRGGMMGGYGYGNAPNAKAITLDQAVTNAQQYATAYNNADLKLVEVEEYASSFYGVVREKSTGTNAFQILVDKFSGAVYPEMGPNMMWNTKYSPMASMMGGWFNQSAGKMTVTVDQARTNASQYLKTYLPNAAVEDTGDTFYGYYNFDVLQNGKTYGMLSVNGYTGAVWYHTWHGDFVSAKSLE